jgi:hypothetical protein
MKYLKVFENFSDLFKTDSFGLDKRIVDLTIIEYKGEKEIATLNITKKAADSICKAINSDRDSGGSYGAYYT